MPLPLIPLLIGGASLIVGGYGVKKGLDAKENFDKAKEIGEDAAQRHQKEVDALNRLRKRTNTQFKNLGRLKAEIFSNQIKQLVDEVKKRKSSSASLKGFKEVIESLNLPQLEKMVVSSLALESGLASGAVSGALVSLGAYGSVGMLATASTGTAIAGLSGAAATNATLAWLGGGALSAGGLGMAGGTAILGGLVAGPALAITGLVMASQAEEALTEARAYEAEVDTAIAEIGKLKIVLNGLQKNAKEQEMVLDGLTRAFDSILLQYQANRSNNSKFDTLIKAGVALRDTLRMPIMEKNGSSVKNLKAKLRASSSGFLEYKG